MVNKENACGIKPSNSPNYDLEGPIILEQFRHPLRSRQHIMDLNELGSKGVLNMDVTRNQFKERNKIPSKSNTK